MGIRCCGVYQLAYRKVFGPVGFCDIDAEDNYHCISYRFNCGLLGEFVEYSFRC